MTLSVDASSTTVRDNAVTKNRSRRRARSKPDAVETPAGAVATADRIAALAQRILDADWVGDEVRRRLQSQSGIETFELDAIDCIDISINILFDPNWYRTTYNVAPAVGALKHYLMVGATAGNDPHPLFDTRYYLRQPGVSLDKGEIPLVHFLEKADLLRANCHPLFDIAWYLAHNPDVAASTMVAFVHYLSHGWHETRDPSPIFSIQHYLACGASPDQEPIRHYMLHNHSAGLTPLPDFRPEAIAAVFKNIQPGQALAAYGRVMNAGFLARTRARPTLGWAEPGIVPPPPRRQAALAGEPTLTALRALAGILPLASTGDAIGYQVQKLQAQRAGVPLSDEFNAALARAGKDQDPGILLGALGIASGQSMASNQDREHQIPLLNSYRSLQHAVAPLFNLMHGASGTVTDGPMISIIMPVYRTPLAFLERAILSVVTQTYVNWELLAVDDSSGDAALTGMLSAYAAINPRIRVVLTPKNGGIAKASNIALGMATGEFLALLDHDDMLTSNALAVMAREILRQPETDLLYSDECKIDVDDIPDTIMTKPDWSPLLLTSFMYTGHLSVYRTQLVRQVGGFRSEFDFSQDYDLVLRVAEQAGCVRHVRECLYGWRMISGSAAQGGKPEARQSNVAALQSAADRRGRHGTVIALPHSNRIVREPAHPLPTVSLIIPSDNPANILQTIASIAAFTSYGAYEIVVVTNSRCAQTCREALTGERVVFTIYDKPYSFSAKCNAGADTALGKYVVFFNDDVRVITPDWIESLLEVLEVDGVGIVGPKLLYEDGTIQHAGMVTGTRRLVGTAFHTFPADTSAHFNLAQSIREVSLICGACLAMPINLFKRIGGYDALNTPVSHSDVDLCFRVREAGYSCIYTPHAVLTHIGHVSIGEEERKPKPFRQDKADIFIMRRFGRFVADDPYFPPGIRRLAYVDFQEEFAFYRGEREDSAFGPDALLVSHDLSNSGAPKIVYDMARVLLSQGRHVTVISPEDGPFRQQLITVGADVVVDPRFFSMDEASISFARNYDMVVCNTVVCWPVIAPIAKFTVVHLYVHETELVHYYNNLSPFFRENLHHATSIWCGSERSATELRSLDFQPVILTYGVEAPEPDDAGETDLCADAKADIRIAILATIEPRKGQDLAIKGFLQLPDDLRAQCHLTIAGRVNDADFAEAIRTIAEPEPNIKFVPELSYAEYLASLRMADIIICPSRDDTLPLVSLNALSEGKILICSKEVGTSDFLTDRVSGFVLDQNHPNNIACTIAEVAALRDEWHTIRLQARQTFASFFSMEQFERAFLLLIEASRQSITVAAA